MRMSVELELRELFLATARSLLVGSFRSAVQPLLNLPAGAWVGLCTTKLLFSFNAMLFEGIFELKS